MSPKRTYVEKGTSRKVEVEESEEPQKAKTSTEEEMEASAKLLDEIDELLDDLVGQSSAQAFVDAYQQKGGE